MTQNDESGTSGYVVSASTQENTDRQAWKVFNNLIGYLQSTETGSVSYPGSNGWRSVIGYDTNGVYTKSPPANLGTDSGGTAFTSSDEGEWIQIKLPNKIYLKRFSLQPRYSIGFGIPEFVKNGNVWGSNDGTSWYRVYTFTNITPTDETTFITFDDVNSLVAYNYFALVVNETNRGSTTRDRTSLNEWELFGLPEYDPEAHGADVTIKSVANVPNTDWLEVYYDAKDLEDDATLLAVSGLGGTTINGTILGDPQVSNKAFVFDGSGDAIVSGATSLIGNPPLSYSVWFKTNSIISGSNSIVAIGYADGTKSIGFRIENGGTYRFYVYSGATNESVTTTIKAEIGIWTHATVVYDGLKSKLYIDGQFALQNTNTTTGLALDSGAKVALGNYIDSSGNITGTASYDGSIANFRLFNRALTSDEIYQLYAYQKEYFGLGDLSMTLKAGRLGIGTSEPKAALDVRGDTFSTLYKGGRTTFLTWDYLGQRSTVFSAAGNTGGVATQVNILDNTFDIPSCYHHLGTANLKAYVKIDWRGESQYSWNFGFTIEVTYNGNQIVYSSSSDHSSTSGNKINGLPCISADFTNFDSTPTAASVTSMFSLPNCDVSSGSQLKVQLVGKHGDSGTGQTLWTGRTKGFSTTSPAHELPTTSFFVVLDVEDGY